jgi:peptidoglycan/LPS O-acetylase OafA/YrhL
MARRETHVPVLDAIRGLAILLVLINHFIGEIPFPNSFLGRIIDSLAKSTWVGVDLFFVLSGFLITGILYDTLGSRNYFRAFYARRFLRIFPLYYGFLFLVIAFSRPLQIEWHGRQYLYLAYLQNTGIARHIFSIPLSPCLSINHLWSLAVEEQFYFVWPAVVFLCRNRLRLMGLAIALVLGSIAVRILMVHLHAPLGSIYTFTPARADSLMMGAILALAMRSSPQTRSSLSRAALWVLPGSLALLLALAWPDRRLNWENARIAIFGYTLLALAGAALIVLSLMHRRVQAAINQPVMRQLGKYSYGIYVLHYPILTFLYYLDLPGRVGFEGGALGPRLLTSATAATASILLAVLSFQFYESRFLRLKRYFQYEFPVLPAGLEAAAATCQPMGGQGSAPPAGECQGRALRPGDGMP